MIDINQWISVLTKPMETFRKHKKVELNKAMISIAVAGLIAGIIAALSNFVAVISVLGYFGAYGGYLLGTTFTPVITIPVFAVIGWLVFSWLVDFVAKSSKKKSNFEEVASIVSIVLPPIMVLGSIAIWIPFVGFLLRTLISLYGLYLAALALNNYYKLGYKLPAVGFEGGKK